jgi:histidinol-phosphatase
MPKHDLKDRLLFAYDAALAAGRVTLEYFGRDDLRVERKADASPVTAADRAAEEELRRLIAATYPRDAVLGEEFGETPGESGYRWILDPIDGTKSFVQGVPLYGTLVAVEEGGRGVVGVIHLPALRETVYAARGLGAHWVQGNGDPRPARVSAVRTLAQGVCLTNTAASFGERRAIFEALLEASRLTRGWGDCYGYALVATGRAEVMVDPRMSVWDAAAIQPVLEEAGGTFTDWKGEPTIRGGEGIGTNGAVLNEVMAITRNAPRP